MKAQTQIIRLERPQGRCWCDVINSRGELDQCESVATHIECQLAGATYGYWCDAHTKLRREAMEVKHGD